MADTRFRVQDGTGKPIDPHTCIFPILKEIGPHQTRLVGTGFFITKVGHFVTAKHVIGDVLDLTTGQQTGYLHALHFVERFKVLVRHITNVSVHNASDIAVGKMDYHVMNSTGEPLTNRSFRFTTEVPGIGSTVCTYAYPESDRIFKKGEPSKFAPNFYSGELMAHSEQARDRALVSWPHFTTSINLKGGASGGPVFDEKGRVFGVNCVGGIDGISYMARVRELLSLLVPEFPGTDDQHGFTVRDLAKVNYILFEPTLE